MATAGRLNQGTVQEKLAERLEEPRVPSAKLSGHSDRYMIKLRSVGYRLVYEVQNKRLVVLVVALENVIRAQSTRL